MATYNGLKQLQQGSGPLKMLPYAPGQGAGVFNQIFNDPTRMGSLLGKPGASTALAGAPGAVPGAAPPPALPGAPGGPAATPTAGTGNIWDQTTGSLSSALKGELPPDVVNMLQQQNAEHAVGGGISGSQAANYQGLRTLGLTSLDRINRAQELLAGGLMSPKQQAELDLEKERNARQDKQFAQDLAFRRESERNRADLANKEFLQGQLNAANELAFKKLLNDQSLTAGKYGGLPGVTPERNSVPMHWSPYGGGGWEPMQYGVTSML